MKSLSFKYYYFNFIPAQIMIIKNSFYNKINLKKLKKTP